MRMKNVTVILNALTCATAAWLIAVIDGALAGAETTSTTIAVPLPGPTMIGR